MLFNKIHNLKQNFFHVISRVLYQESVWPNNRNGNMIVYVVLISF
jgi:hypothetical protein